MNPNEVESRCYANGNVNKADEVPTTTPSRILHIPLLNRLKNEKKNVTNP